MKRTLPLYRIVVKEDDDLGVDKTSLVDYPAVESNFLTFGEDKVKLSFKVEDESEHKLLGVVLRADYPIYRIGPSGYEYAIVFDKETIEVIAKKMMKSGNVNNFGLDHETDTDGVEIVELFIKDSSKGISPKGFEDVEEGSLFAVAHVTDEGVWASIMSGERNGFSVEIYSEIEEMGLVEMDFSKPKSKIETINELIKLLDENEFKD